VTRRLEHRSPTQVLTEGSFDAIMWQTLPRKAEFIDQIMSGKIQGREVDDIGGSDTVLSFAEFKAISSGNRLLLDLANADRDVQRLQRLDTAWERNEWSMQQTISGAADAIPKLERRIDALTAAAERLTPTRGDHFRMQIGDRVFTARTDTAEALQNRVHRECYNGCSPPSPSTSRSGSSNASTQASPARQNGTRFGRPLSDPVVIADKLAIATDARAQGRTAEDAPRLVGWSRGTF
jgi:hypothetical protein